MRSGSPPTLWWLLIAADGPSTDDRLDDVRIQRALREEVEAAQLARLRLEDVDERRADDLALLLGVGDAGQALEEERPCASTKSSGSCSFSRKRFCTCVGFVERAAARCRRRCTSAGRRWRGGSAAPRPSNRRRRTAPQTTRPSPTCARIRAVASSMNDAIVQSPVQPQTSNAKLRRISRPRSVCATSGWNSSAYRPRSASSIAATGALALVATTRKPGRRGRDEVAVARPHAQLVGHAVEERAPSASLTRAPCAWPNSRCAARRDAAAERVGHQLHAVADAEHRHAQLEQRRDRTAARPLPTRSSGRPTG